MQKNSGSTPIPDDVLIPALNQVTKQAGMCCDNFGEMEASQVRTLCGAAYRFVETDWIRKRGINLRKAYRLEKVRNGKTKKKYSKPRGEYARYLASQHWSGVRMMVLDFWGYRCCLCCSKAVDIHHNNYICLQEETLQDVVPLCRTCHMKVHGILPDGNEILNKREGAANGSLFD